MECRRGWPRFWVAAMPWSFGEFGALEIIRVVRRMRRSGDGLPGGFSQELR